MHNNRNLSRLLLSAVIFAACHAGPTRGQGDDGVVPADTQRESNELGRIPRSPDAFRTRAQFVQERLAELRPTTQPATAPTDDVAVQVLRARTGLFDAWRAYLAVLEQAEALAAEIARLRAPDQLETSSSELSEIESETERLKQAPLPQQPDETLVRSLESEVAEAQASLRKLEEAHAQRKSTLAEGVEQRRHALEQELATLRRQKAGVRQSPDATSTAPAPHAELRELEQLTLEVRIATVELRLDSLDLETQRLELLVSRAEPRLGALRRRLEVVDARQKKVAESWSRRHLEALERERDETASPAESALIELRLFHERAVRAYFRDPEQLADIEARATEARAKLLSEQVAMGQAYWKRILERLAYRPDDELTALYEQVQEEFTRYAQQLDEAQSTRADALEYLRTLRAMRERARERMDSLAKTVHDTAESVDASRRAEIDAEVAAVRAETAGVVGDTIGRAREAVDHADAITSTLSEHVRYLTEIEGMLYWQRLTSRGTGLLGTDWRSATRELGTIVSGLAGEPVADQEQVDDLESAFFGREARMRVSVRGQVQSAARDLRAMGARGWVLAGVSVLAALIVGLLATRVLRARSVPLARVISREYDAIHSGEQAVGRGLSSRVNLCVLNMLGDLAVPLLIAITLVVGAQAWLAGGEPRALLTWFVVIVVSMLVLWRLVQHLFEADSAPHRLLPCTDAVAAHFRRWLIAVIVFTAVLLGLPFLLDVAGLGGELAVALRETYQAGLLLLLLFLLRKDQILGLVAGASAHWSFTIATVLLPLFQTLVLALLVLQVIGYGLLVTHIGTGIAASLGVVLIAAVVSEYLVDLIRYGRPRVRRADEGEAVEAQSRYLVDLIVGFVRLAAFVGGLLLVLRVWKVPLREEWLNWQTYAKIAIVLAVGLMVDRVLAAALDALQGSGRLPPATTTLIRRWLRLVLVALVVLTLVALAGWDVMSIWAFLTTLLAMVAIGFVAVWSILSNVLATLVILVWRPFNVGDWIELKPDGVSGTVIDISFMYTVLKGEDGERTCVPNNFFAQKFIACKAAVGRPRRTLAEQLERDTPLGE